MIKGKKVICAVFCILTVLHVMFVFSNSLRTAEVSGTQSGVFVEFIAEKLSVLGFDVQNEECKALITTFVRKTAHFSEFALLAVYCFLALYTADKKLSVCVISTVLFCFATGCIDETLQLFSEGRSCQLSDALLDTAGGAFGTAVAGFVSFFVSKKPRGK